jgi:hypothetical protein
MSSRIIGSIVAVLGILMSLNAFISGPRAFGGRGLSVIGLMHIGFGVLIAGLIILRKR